MKRWPGSHKRASKKQCHLPTRSRVPMAQMSCKPVQLNCKKETSNISISAYRAFARIAPEEGALGSWHHLAHIS
eukprot:5609834-Amphidinium_carterae.1